MRLEGRTCLGFQTNAKALERMGLCQGSENLCLLGGQIGNLAEGSGRIIHTGKFNR